MPVDVARSLPQSFQRVLGEADKKLVKIEGETTPFSKDIKVGYSTFAGKMKFEALSDTPDIRQGVAYASDRTKEITTTREVIAKAIALASAEELNRLLGPPTSAQESGRRAEFRADMKNQTLALLFGDDTKGDKMSDVSRITVGNLRNAVDSANKAVRAKVRVSQLKAQQKTPPANFGQALFRTGRRAAAPAPAEAGNVQGIRT